MPEVSRVQKGSGAARIGRLKSSPSSTGRLWIGAIAIPLAAAGLVCSGTGRWFDVSSLSAFERARIATQMFLAVGGIAVVVAPLAGVWMVMRMRCLATTGSVRSGFPAVHDTWSIGARLAGAATLLSTTTAGVGYMLAPEASGPIWASHAVLGSAVLALAAVGTSAAAAINHPLDAAAVAIGGSLVLSIGVLVAGPVLDRLPDASLSTALIASPIVATAASAHIDLFRTDPIYQLSPLAHMRVDYPSPGDAFAWHTVVAVFLFIGTALCLRRVDASSVERMSA